MFTEADLPWLKAPLMALRDDTRGHAVILHGGAGSGQFELALRAAQAWLCERPPGPCGECPSCRLAVAHSHTDLRVVLPETIQMALKWHGADAEGGDAEPADGEGRSKRKPSKEIRVEAVRQAIDWAHTSSGRGRGKVLVFYPAQAMNTVAANALLKTLEEPAAGLRMLLCVDDPARLLPTLRSRCQWLHLSPPSATEALTWLEGQGVADAAALLRACGGEPLAALDAASQGLTGTVWAALPAQVARGQTEMLVGLPVPAALRALQQLCHDLMAVTAGATPRYFDAASMRPVADWSALTAWSQALTQAVRHQDHPWNAGLLLDALVAQGQRVMDTGRPVQRRSVVTPESARVGTLRT